MLKKVELWCKAENVKVGEITTEKTLSKIDLENGLNRLDALRCPEKKELDDGKQMVCKHCLNDLYFKVAGELIMARVGVFRVE